MSASIHPSCAHFTWAEVSDPTRPILDSVVHLVLEASDRFWRHMELLEKLRAQYGRGLRITSGWRSPQHNRDVGGARLSQHIDFATDILPVGYPSEPLVLPWWRETAARIGFTGIGLYPDHVHLDLRPGPRAIWEEE